MCRTPHYKLFALQFGNVRALFLRCTPPETVAMKSGELFLRAIAPQTTGAFGSKPGQDETGFTKVFFAFDQQNSHLQKHKASISSLKIRLRVASASCRSIHGVLDLGRDEGKQN
jgi:hypothetical protein